MIERIVSTNHRSVFAAARAFSYFMALEKIPLPRLIVSAQPASISTIRGISMSGLSPMSHVHASMPIAIEEGLKAMNGKLTNSWRSSYWICVIY
jgi:hypothetical protein